MGSIITIIILYNIANLSLYDILIFIIIAIIGIFIGMILGFVLDHRHMHVYSDDVIELCCPRPVSERADAVSPQSPYINNLNDILKKLWDSLPLGYIVFNPPVEMNIGSVERIEARIAKELIDKLNDGFSGRGIPQLEKIKVSTCMIVHLDSDAFKIKPLFAQEEMAIIGDYTQWDWDVTPIRGGTQKLNLIVDAVLEIPGYANRTKHLRILERVINIKVNYRYQVKNFLKIHWRWTLGTAVAIATVIVMWLKD